MNSGQKTAVSLVLTAGLFVAFIFTYYTNLFSKIETQFYEPERIKQERIQLAELSDFCDSYILTLLYDLGEGYVKEPSVKSFLSQSPIESEVTNRVQLSGELFARLPGLDGFRLVDKNGRDIHYSSYPDDIVKQNGTKRIYKNYTEIQKAVGEMPFETIAVLETGGEASPKVTFNTKKNFINLSFPFFDKYNIFRGTFVFSFRATDLERELIKANQISVSDKITMFASDDNLSGGFLIGIPKVGQEFFTEPVLENWKSKSSGPDKVVEAEDENYWVILSDYTSKYLSVSKVYCSDFFELPTDTKYLICVCVFITAFLLLFMLLSLKHDDMVIIRSRIKKIQFALIAEYLENKENVDWQQVSRQIESRKGDLFADVKKSLGRKGKRHAKEVDALLNKSWEEILSAIGSKQNYQAALSYNDAASSAEIKKMLEEVLSTTQLKVQSIQALAPVAEGMTPIVTPSPAKNVRYFDDVEITPDEEPIEEAESIDDEELVEEGESVDEVESIDEAEVIGKGTSIDEVESLDEVEEIEDGELVEETEPIEEVENLDDAELVEENKSIEDTESLDEVEEIEEAESFDEVELIEETESFAEVESLVNTEPIEETETFDEVEPLAETEVIDETASLVESNPIDETESLAESEPIDEAESLSESEPINEAELLYDAGLIEETKPLDEDESFDEMGMIAQMKLLEEEVETFEGGESFDDVYPVAKTDLFEEVKVKDNLKPVAEIKEMPLPEVDDSEITEIEQDNNENEFDDIGLDEFFSDSSNVKAEREFPDINDDLFEEKLELGEGEPSETLVSDEDEESFDFETSDPDFGATEELEPIEERTMFAMTSFGDNVEDVAELVTADEPETIVEVNGVFSIAENLELPKFELDKNFKKLVDSVLSV